PILCIPTLLHPPAAAIYTLSLHDALPISMITFDEGIGRVTGYSLGGRRDIEAGVRETLKPVESWGANHHTYDAFFGTDNKSVIRDRKSTRLNSSTRSSRMPSSA